MLHMIQSTRCHWPIFPFSGILKVKTERGKGRSNSGVPILCLPWRSSNVYKQERISQHLSPLQQLHRKQDSNFTAPGFGLLGF